MGGFFFLVLSQHLKKVKKYKMESIYLGRVACKRFIFFVLWVFTSRRKSLCLVTVTVTVADLS